MGLLRRVTEGIARQSDEGWSILDPADPDPALGLDPLEDLEGKRVRVTVEVLEPDTRFVAGPKWTPKAIANLGPKKAVSAHDFSVPVPAGAFFADEQALADFLKGKTCSQCGEPFGARHHQIPALTLTIGDGSDPGDPGAISFTWNPKGGPRG